MGIEEKYKKVLALVKQGNTIQLSLSILGDNGRTTFYRGMSKEQKRELKIARLTNGAYASNTRIGFNIVLDNEMINTLANND